MNLIKMVVMTRQGLVIGMIGLVMSMAVLLVGCPLQPVFFPDHALESAVRAELQKPFGVLIAADLSNVRELDGRDLGIENLTGLEYCQNLAWLDLGMNKISDLSPLEQLGRPENPFDSTLEYLNLDNNEIKDISALSGLLNLKILSLSGNQLDNINPLVANATNMGLGEGDYLILTSSTLSEQALAEDIPALLTFGVIIIGTTDTTTTGTTTGK